MNTTTAIEQIGQSIKDVCHSKIGRYFVTQRGNDFMFLPIEEYRDGEINFGFFTEIDLICGLSPCQWQRLSDHISEAEECYE